MLIYVSGFQVAGLSSRDESSIKLGSERSFVNGVAMSAEAIAARAKIVMFVCAILTVSVWAITVWLFSAPPREGAKLFQTAALFAALLLPLMVLRFYEYIKDRPGAWAKRLYSIPEPGTRIAVSSEGLSVGRALAAWSTLTVERVDLSFTESRYGYKTYYVTALSLRAPDFAIVIDTLLVREGEAIAAEIYRRLCRPVLNPPIQPPTDRTRNTSA